MGREAIDALLAFLVPMLIANIDVTVASDEPVKWFPGDYPGYHVDSEVAGY